MTSNTKLKQDCKATLDTIRELLPQADRQNIEPHLRQIFELTKGLMENAKVSPEEHEASTLDNRTLKNERTQLSGTIEGLRQELRREQEKESKLKDAFASLEAEKDRLDDLLTNVVLRSFYDCAVNAIRLIDTCGDSGLTKWVNEMRASKEFDNIERRALITVSMMVTTALFRDEKVLAMFESFRPLRKPNRTNT